MNYEWSLPEQITVVESTSDWYKVELKDGTSIPKAYIVLAITRKLLKTHAHGQATEQPNI